MVTDDIGGLVSTAAHPLGHPAVTDQQIPQRMFETPVVHSIELSKRDPQGSQTHTIPTPARHGSSDPPHRSHSSQRCKR
ncbi:hypothetical protein GCM10010287_35810 [Streptomyces variabilis]|uniref:Uncharacterized protein n=1 Tax=Streptomyces variabilis TaxID=67372 RepID=A0ABQ2TZP0_9ACTN|nr:hypothetical protein GCM10010287_35810 [Streptomyces variabilis]